MGFEKHKYSLSTWVKTLSKTFPQLKVCSKLCFSHVFMQPFEMPPAQQVQSPVHTWTDQTANMLLTLWNRNTHWVLYPMHKVNIKATPTRTHTNTHTPSCIASTNLQASCLKTKREIKVFTGNIASNLHKHTPSFPHSWYSSVIIAGRLKAC